MFDEGDFDEGEDEMNLMRWSGALSTPLSLFFLRCSSWCKPAQCRAYNAPALCSARWFSFICGRLNFRAAQYNCHSFCVVFSQQNLPINATDAKCANLICRPMQSCNAIQSSTVQLYLCEPLHLPKRTALHQINSLVCSHHLLDLPLYFSHRLCIWPIYLAYIFGCCTKAHCIAPNKQLGLPSSSPIRSSPLLFSSPLCIFLSTAFKIHPLSCITHWAPERQKPINIPVSHVTPSPPSIQVQFQWNALLRTN